MKLNLTMMASSPHGSFVIFDARANPIFRPSPLNKSSKTFSQRIKKGIDIEDNMLINDFNYLLDDQHKIPSGNHLLRYGEPAKYLTHDDLQKERAEFIASLQNKKSECKISKLMVADNHPMLHNFDLLIVQNEVTVAIPVPPVDADEFVDLHAVAINSVQGST